MTDFGLFTSRFHDNTTLLRKLDEALEYFREVRDKSSVEVSYDQVQRLLDVLRPISEMLGGRLSDNARFDERRIVDILQQRHSRNWQAYRQSIIQFSNRLGAGDTNVNDDDLEVLNDIADAIDIECATLFRRISGRA